jgi:uncharacterized phage protein (TIGR02220 family)
MSQVWELQSLTLPRKMLLLAIADYASDEGVAWPAVKALMCKCSLKSDSGTRRAINELVELDWIRKEERPRKERRGRHQQETNMYHINLKKLQDEAFIQPAHRDPSKSEPAHGKALPYDDSPHALSCYEAAHRDPSKSEPAHGKASPYDDSPHNPSYGTKKTESEPVPGTADPSVNSKPDPSSKNTFWQPPLAEAQDENLSKEIKFTDEAIEVLKHLNQLTGAKYTTIKTNLQNIRARLTDGHDKDSLILVVDYLVSRWLGTEWAKFLNPETMFRPTKFDGNLLAASAWYNEGRKSPSQPLQARNHTERDAAYKRFISGTGQNVKPGQLEITVNGEASKAGIRSMSASFAVQRWNAIWKECSQRIGGEATA